MNNNDREKLLQELVALLCEFEVHPKLFEDIKEYQKKHSNSSMFLELFIDRLKFLDNHKHMATQLNPNNFETCKKSKGLCSLHIDTPEINYRVLYTLKYGTVLLLGFDEIAGKNKTDYSKYIPKAQQRLKDFTGGK